MSFTLYAVACESILPEKIPIQSDTEPGRDAFSNPRTVGCSGCTPAEPYPLSRRKSSTQSLNIVRNNDNRRLN